MTFLKYKDADVWWEWNKEKMIAYNYLGGHHNINENSLGDAEYCECDNWHDLFLKKHYCPIQTDIATRDVWISPNGKYYNGDAHAVQAEYICDVIFGMNDSDIYYAEDYLSNNGWIKATTSFMWDICYYSALCNSIMPQAQFDALWDWCQFHHQDFPEGIEVV